MGKDVRSIYTESMYDLISNIVEVVVNSYFYWVQDASFKQDLMQEGFLKAYELLRTGNYDPNQSLRNYLYTGVRNAMSNLNYHNNKEKHSSYDLYDDNVETDSFCFMAQKQVYINYNVDIDIIKKSCDKFNSKYIGNVINYLHEIGVYDETTDDVVLEPNNLILKSIIVDIMWNIGG